MRITARRWPAQRRACSRINQSSRHLMLVAKPRNRKWRLILRTCCPPPAAALRAAYARCARVFSLFFCLFHSVILPKKCRARRLFGALHVRACGRRAAGTCRTQMGPPGGLRAPAEATLVVPRHPPDSCCAALACVAADGGTPCAAAPQSRHCRRHTCPQMRRVPVRPRQTGLVADRQPARCLRRRPASRIVVTFRRPTSRASGRVLDDGHAQLTGLVA